MASHEEKKRVGTELIQVAIAVVSQVILLYI